MSYQPTNQSWDSKKADPDNFLIDSDEDEQPEVIEPDQPAASTSASASVPQGPPPSYSLDNQFAAATGGRVEQRRFMGGDTLDEPVTTTLMRDIRSVGFRLRQVVWYTPASSLQENHPEFIPASLSNFASTGEVGVSHSQEWDMWGPLVFCLLIALTMSMIAPNHQASKVFSGIFVLTWVGQAVVTLNIKLLGGSISFFYALSVTGYCLFPLVIAALVSAFVKLFLVRIIVDIIMIGWAIYSATRGLRDNGVLPSRVVLAMFPVGLFYAGLGWLCVIT